MKWLFLFPLIILSLAVKAQNLVVNPSFEVYTACPDNTGGDVYKATGWDTCRQSADYFNTCALSSYFDVPTNTLGFQYPAYGNAYCGFYTYANTFYRELIIGSLTSPLVVSQKYYLSFKVSRADSNFVVAYSTNRIGAKMSTVLQYNVPINNMATVYTNSVVSDTVGWTKISGSFIADSAYQYIMLGNFFDDANTSVVDDGTGGSLAYYYIDEVCLSTDSVYTANYITNIGETNEENDIGIHPNPVNEYLSINGIDKMYFKIYNSIGQIIYYEPEENTESFNINTTFWPSGIYFISFKKSNYKLIVNH